MARAFRVLTKRVKSRKKQLTARTNFVARIAALEVMLYELNSRIVREINATQTPDSSPSDFDADFLQAAEEYRDHLGGVINGS